MTISVIDLEELKRFHASLEAANKELANTRKKLTQVVEESRSFWKDEQRALFEAKFSTLTLPMQTFERKAKDYCEWAERKHAAGHIYIGRNR
jgi:hypothetical protein